MDDVRQRHGAARRVRVVLFGLEVREDLEDLDQHAPCAGRGHGEHAPRSEAGREGPSLDGPGDLRQVVPADQSVVGLHVALDVPRDAPGVEVLDAGLAQSLERRGQCRLTKHLARAVRAVILLEEVHRGSALLELGRFAARERALERRHRVAVASEAHGGCQHRFERQRAVTGEGVAENRRRAGNGAADVPATVGLDRQCARLHAVGGARRAVERHVSPTLGEVQEQHRLAPEPRRCRLADPECKRGGNRGVDGVAALGEHLHAGFRRRRLLRPPPCRAWRRRGAAATRARASSSIAPAWGRVPCPRSLGRDRCAPGGGTGRAAPFAVRG